MPATEDCGKTARNMSVNAQRVMECNSLVCSFRLTVSFWVVTGGEVKLHVECDSKGLEEVRHKFGSSIRSDVAQDAMLREDMKNE